MMYFQQGKMMYCQQGNFKFSEHYHDFSHIGWNQCKVRHLLPQSYKPNSQSYMYVKKQNKTIWPLFFALTIMPILGKFQKAPLRIGYMYLSFSQPKTNV